MFLNRFLPQLDSAHVGNGQVASQVCLTDGEILCASVRITCVLKCSAPWRVCFPTSILTGIRFPCKCAQSDIRLPSVLRGEALCYLKPNVANWPHLETDLRPWGRACSNRACVVNVLGSVSPYKPIGPMVETLGT